MAISDRDLDMMTKPVGEKKTPLPENVEDWSDKIKEAVRREGWQSKSLLREQEELSSGSRFDRLRLQPSAVYDYAKIAVDRLDKLRDYESKLSQREVNDRLGDRAEGYGVDPIAEAEAIRPDQIIRMSIPPETIDDRGPNFRFTEEELLYPPETIDDRGPNFRFTEEELRAPAGINGMKEKAFDGIEGAQELVTSIRAGLQDPARAMSEGATEEDIAMAQSMTDAQLLEFVTELGTQAEADGMGEESPEDKAIRLFKGMDKFDEMGRPEDINFAPTGMNYGGPAKQYYNMGGATHTMPDGTVHPGATHEEYEQMLAGGMPMRMNPGGLASMGRMEDTQLAHVAPGERIVPDWVLGDKGEEMLDAAFIRAGIDPLDYTVGSGQNSINPRTGMPEYTSFFRRLFKKVKKLAPAIGTLVGFRYGGARGAGIGKAIGGVIKTGDLDFGKALSDFGTGWSLGNVATGMGMQQGPIFRKGTHVIEANDTLSSVAGEYGVTEQDIIDANPNISTGSSITMGVGDTIKIPGKGMWGLSPTPGQGGVGGFMQNIGARIAGDKNIDLMDEFKNLPMGQKLAVGALGLNALSQTGMFDEEELGQSPEYITGGIQGLADYTGQPLRVTNQSPYKFNPSIGQPVGVTQYTPIASPSKSFKQILAELREDNLRTPFPSFG